jgi:hypothetical protein
MTKKLIKTDSTDSNEPILICRHLLEGADLFQVYRLPQESHKWQLICEGTHEKTDMIEISIAKSCELFPDFCELLDVPTDMMVMFQKGENSGKWYDFHFK